MDVLIQVLKFAFLRLSPMNSPLKQVRPQVALQNALNSKIHASKFDEQCAFSFDFLSLIRS
jgi:hypothetical protein